MTSRSEIRRAFADLVTGLPSTGKHVFESRKRPFSDSDLPAIVVSSGESVPEEASVIGLQKPALMAYRLRADIYVKDSASAEVMADQILDEVTGAIFRGIPENTLSGRVHSTRLVQVGEPDLDDLLEKPAVLLPVLFETIYSF